MSDEEASDVVIPYILIFFPKVNLVVTSRQLKLALNLVYKPLRDTADELSSGEWANDG